MTLLFVSFVVASFVLVVLLLLESGGLVSIPPRLSALLPYLFHFSLFAVTATILLLGISALSEAATPR